MCPIAGCGARLASRPRIHAKLSSGGGSGGQAWQVVGALAFALVMLIFVVFAGKHNRRPQRKAHAQRRAPVAQRVLLSSSDDFDLRALGITVLFDPALGGRALLRATDPPEGAPRWTHLQIEVGSLLTSIGAAGQSRSLIVLRGQTLERGSSSPIDVAALDLDASYFRGGVHFTRLGPPATEAEQAAAQLVRSAAAQGLSDRGIRLAVLMEVHDPPADQLVPLTTAPDREALLREVWGFFAALPTRAPAGFRAFAGFVPPRSLDSYRPPQASSLKPYESFAPIQHDADREGLDALLHAYARLPLTPAQAASLLAVHRDLSGIELAPTRLLTQLERAATLEESLLLIDHLERVLPALGRGLRAAYAEGSLEGARERETSAAAEVSRWKASSAREGLYQGVLGVRTAEGVVNDEVRRRGERLEALAANPDQRLGSHLPRLAAQDPRRAGLLEACVSDLEVPGARSANAARALVWLLRGGLDAAGPALARASRSARDNALEEASHVLPSPTRAQVYHDLLTSSAEARPALERQLIGLAARNALGPHDLGVWCALSEGREELPSLRARVESDPLREALAYRGQLDRRGRLAIARVLIGRASDAGAEADRLGWMTLPPDEQRAILGFVEERDPSGALGLAAREYDRDDLPEIQLEGLRLAQAQVPGTRAHQRMVLAALRSRNSRVRDAAAAGLSLAFWERPAALQDICALADDEVAIAAARVLVKRDPARASLVLSGWVRKGSARRQLAAVQAVKDPETDARLRAEVLRLARLSASDARARARANELLGK